MTSTPGGVATPGGVTSTPGGVATTPAQGGITSDDEHGALLTGCVRRQEEAAGLYLASGGRAREMQARYTYPLHLL